MGPSPEALGPGSRRVPRRRDADPPAGAFLTGLRTAVGPASRQEGGAMLTLLRLPFLLVLSDADSVPTRTTVFVSNWLMGSAPRARQGEAPAHAGADPGGLPGLPRCP